MGKVRPTVALTSSDITDGAVIEAKIGGDAVTSAKINDGAIVNADINASAAIAQSKLATLAIDTAELSADAVTPAKMADSAFLANRNIMINGDMRIAQRAQTAAAVGAGFHTVDRWYVTKVNSGTWTQTQDSGTIGTTGFTENLKMDCTTALASLAAGDRLMVTYRAFEGRDLQGLKKGTAAAESVTISFWVNATKTGTYILEMYDSDNSRHICQAYTVSVTNTWEYKALTFAGDTTGLINDDNQLSVQLQFYMAAGTTYTSGTLATSWAAAVSANRAVGQVNAADSTDNNFQITGTQMEIGTTATPFERKTYAQELQACQRYYREIAGYTGVGRNSTATIRVSCPISPEMRVTPSVTLGGDNNFQDGDGTVIAGDGLSNLSSTSSAYAGIFTVSGTAPQAHRPYIHAASGGGTSKLSAEM